MVRKKSLSLEEVEKTFSAEYGDDVFLRGSEEKVLRPIPTGLLSLDKMLGGGIPRGRITEIFGAPSSCKTLLLLSTIAQAQREGGIAVYIDYERTFDPSWAKLNGVDVEELRILKPAYGEQGYDMILQLLMTNEVSIIGLDSIAQAVPKAELDGGMTDANIGLAARMNAKAMRKLTSNLQNTALVLINQTRANVSTSPFGGSPIITSGGKAIPFYTSLRLNVRRIKWISVQDTVQGAEYRCRIEKCKIPGAKPYNIAHFNVDFDSGLDFIKDVLTHALVAGMVEKRGSWYVFPEDTRIQGEHASKAYMKESGLFEQWLQELMNEDTGTFIE